MRQHLPILPVVVTLGGALLIPIVALGARRVAAPLACVTAGLAAVTAALALADAVASGPLRYAVGGWASPWGIEVVVDGLSGFVAVAIASVATVVLTASGPAVRAGYGPAGPLFYTLALLVLLGLLGMVVSGDLFNVFVFLEVSSIASYALVASAGGRALAAAFRYVVLGTVGASFYLLGVGFLYAATGTLNMADVARLAAGVSASPLLAGGAVFVAVGLAIKMGLFPLHAWLPDAYTHAPAPVVSFLAPVATKAAAYVLARSLLQVIGQADVPVAAAVAWAGGAAVLFGGVMAARQTDARRLLAYSSVSQVGYIAVGLGLGNAPGVAGAYLHILNHALMKAALFVAVGAVAARGGGVAVGALGREMPVTAACAVVAALSMVGVPPAGGFFSKWYLLEGSLAAGEPVLAAVLLAGSLLGAVYMYRLTERVWFAGAERRERGEAPAPVVAGLVVLAVASVAVGVASAPIVARVLGPALPALD